MKHEDYDYESADKTGFYLVAQRPRIDSVEPAEGKEGDIITIKGSGFSPYIRNNCVVIGGMGACARVQAGSTSTELKVRIDPVAKKSQGDILMWPGAGSNFYNEKIASGRGKLHFTETAIFRNGSPVVQARVNFKLTESSKNTFGGELVAGSSHETNLAGHEKGNILCVKFPADFKVSSGSKVDICLVLKEHPTLAIDFTAKIEGEIFEDCLKSIAKTIVVNGAHIGERIFTDVIKNKSTNEYELHVTKPYLEKGLMTVHFDI